MRLLGLGRRNVEHFGELSQILCRFLGRVLGGVRSRIVGRVLAGVVVGVQSGVLVGVQGGVLDGNQFGVEEDVHSKDCRSIDVGGEVELLAVQQDGDRLLEVLERAHLNHGRIEVHVSWLLRVDRAQIQLVDDSFPRESLFILHCLWGHPCKIGFAYGDRSIS